MPTTLLMECHGRIRRFCGGLTALAALPPAQLCEPAATATAAQCARYFRDALPLHARDEEESVLPRLTEDAGVQAALATMQQEHRQIEALLPEVVAVLERLAAGSLPGPGFGDLFSGFVALLMAHIVAEEEAIFPACAAFPPPLRARIVEEIRDRRRR